MFAPLGFQSCFSGRVSCISISTTIELERVRWKA
jgi:hypothetical protein